MKQKLLKIGVLTIGSLVAGVLGAEAYDVGKKQTEETAQKVYKFADKHAPVYEKRHFAVIQHHYDGSSEKLKGKQKKAAKQQMRKVG
jgi:hypothetical protein